MGINISPPLNQSFLENCIFSWLWWSGWMAIYFTLLLVLITWFFELGGWTFIKIIMAQPTFYPGIFVAGVAFGLIMAGYTKYCSKNLKIPKW
jgi:hypothetical protein